MRKLLAPGVNFYIVALLVVLGLVVARVAAYAAGTGAPFGAGLYGAVDVGTSATPVPSAPLLTRNAMGLVNLGTATIYCGWDSGVTTATGYPVSPNGGTFGVDITYDSVQARPKLYCITTVLQTSPLNTRWMEIR
jgi:hypothetical protein